MAQVQGLCCRYQLTGCPWATIPESFKATRPSESSWEPPQSFPKHKDQTRRLQESTAG